MKFSTTVFLVIVIVVFGQEGKLTVDFITQ